ncbi:LacI family transcriptional regulator [Flavobacterium sp. PL11]|uniref:LacI family DNA-binding transcriptional regulator n=1 Tax=Flavobacterium sp. PL11 TaxID=3071717 RepID=UPI002E07A180|nr:LacI family transcriptional regulator [Flavobacterium sp. PL11]
MDKKPTIKDIALLAGVSKGTVDRVLHNRGKVSQKAFESVNSVLNEIDYEPNLIARNLKNNKIYYIIVVLPDPAFDPYWVPSINGIQEAIKESKAFNLSIKIHYFNPDSTESFINVTESVLTLAPDGILLAPLFYKEAVTAMQKFLDQGICVSTFNNQILFQDNINFVGQDLQQSGRVAAKLLDVLQSKGEFAIVHVNEKYENSVFMQEKEKGFKNYFSEKEFNDSLISTIQLQDSNIEMKFNAFINQNPKLNGVFVTTSKAYQIANIIIDANRLDISIVGYDLISENINYLNQGVINFLIHQNPKRQAYLGVMHLIEHFVFGKKIPAISLLPIDIINTENARFYLD